MTSDGYRRLIDETAARWGLTPPMNPEDPRLKLPVAKTHRLTLPKKYEYLTGNASNSISILRYAHLWSFCYSCHTPIGRHGFGPFMKFCRPYGSESEALSRAVAEYCKEVSSYDFDEALKRRMLAWAESLWPPDHTTAQMPL